MPSLTGLSPQYRRQSVARDSMLAGALAGFLQGQKDGFTPPTTPPSLQAMMAPPAPPPGMGMQPPAAPPMMPGAPPPVDPNMMGMAPPPMAAPGPAAPAPESPYGIAAGMFGGGAPPPQAGPPPGTPMFADGGIMAANAEPMQPVGKGMEAEELMPGVVPAETLVEMLAMRRSGMDPEAIKARVMGDGAPSLGAPLPDDTDMPDAPPAPPAPPAFLSWLQAQSPDDPNPVTADFAAAYAQDPSSAGELYTVATEIAASDAFALPMDLRKMLGSGKATATGLPSPPKVAPVSAGAY